MCQVLFALHATVAKSNAQRGINYLKDEVDFWSNRKKLLRYYDILINYRLSEIKFPKIQF